MTTKHTGEECEICPPGTHIIDCTCPLKGRMGQCKDGECFHGAPKEEIENGFPENDLIELAQALSLPGGFNGFTAYKEALKKFDDELRRVIAVASSAPKEETGEEWLEDLWYHAHNWRTAATPEDMAIGVRAMENFIRSARTQAVDEYKKKLEEATKEDPFGDFLKTQGINVVDVTPAQKEEWEQEYITLIGTLMELSAFSAYISSFHHAKTVEFIRSQISLAEARGREEANKCDECGGTDVVCAKGVMDSIRLARTETITAFEEWAGKYMTETTKYYGTDKHGIDPDDLLSFADSLKKKHETN